MVHLVQNLQLWFIHKLVINRVFNGWCTEGRTTFSLWLVHNSGFQWMVHRWMMCFIRDTNGTFSRSSMVALSCVYQQARRIYTFPRAPDQSEPPAPMTVPVGRSVHRMMASCFSSASSPYVNQHSTTVNVFAC